MSGFNAVPKDVNGVPIAEVYPPGSTGNFAALQGSTNTTTDAAGNVSSPANFNLVQINSLAVQMAGSDGVTSADILEIMAGLFNGTTTDQARSTNAGDGLNVGIAAMGPYLYNGATADRQRGNLDNITLLTLAAITSNSQSADQKNYNHRGVKVFIATGSFGASESTMTVAIQGKDPVSGNYYTILTSASLSASGFTVLTVYPGVTASSNVAVSDVLPRTWRVSYSASNWGTGGSTLGISCAYIL